VDGGTAVTRILIAEDDPMLLELFAASLSLLGHTPFLASTPEQALAKLPLVEAAILDGLNGGCWPVLEWAKRMGIPCVLFSGDARLVEAAKAAGFSAILKPAKMEDVLKALEAQRERVEWDGIKNTRQLLLGGKA
jgi:DNA-binding response OmpR family regulator